ncbi:glycosyltransferase family 4 protein [Phenylobacterium sp.]|uniref:glycosyltransferase family 4 protein n=1 Tax=Phenylobacterium sp. TaxID=1871053 RepID=UPI00121D74F9|nr:glycosyltransferase family 4 protein [Phenylobacterium sp.]THD58927.1 MAG: glycosyltransferase [Phenylobacterium sp.]
MPARFSIFHPQGEVGLRQNVFGKDVANAELLRAMAQHGGFEQLDVLSLNPANEAHLREALLADPEDPIRLTSGSILNTRPAREAGVLLRGQPDLQNLAWLRRITGGDRGYSLIGLIHTLAPPAIRQTLANSMLAPTHAWDAIICTSPSVRDATVEMFDAWGGYLAERTGGKPPPRPALPVIPLGVEAERFAGLADRGDARAKVRAQLGLGDADVLVLWVGRLSFFEKAFPQAMFQAVRQARAATGINIHFALAGWFPGENDRGFYEEAARIHAPDTPIHFLDGNDRTLVGELWAGADIFMSLVDNIQETFGITPVEAMAAGLPVVVSDWDGYRYTVRDGQEGFLIPTLGGPPNGIGVTMVERHLFGLATYQRYVGEVALYTGVHAGRAGQAIAELARSPELRRRMGASGRERVRSMLDWPVVARQIAALADELAEVRRASPDPVMRRPGDPVRGDPFASFAGFPTRVLDADLRIAATPGVSGADVRGLTATLDVAFPGLRAPLEDCADVLDRLAAGGRAQTVGEVLAAYPLPSRRGIEMGLAWMAKLGLIDWLV